MNITHVVTARGVDVIPWKETVSFDLTTGEVGVGRFQLSNTFGSPSDAYQTTPFQCSYAHRNAEKGSIARALGKVLEHAKKVEVGFKEWAQVVLSFNRRTKAVYATIAAQQDEKEKFPRDRRIVLTYEGTDICELKAYRSYYKTYQNTGPGIQGKCIITGEEGLIPSTTRTRIPHGLKGIVPGPALSKTHHNAESWGFPQNTVSLMSSKAWQLVGQMASTHYNRPIANLGSMDKYYLRVWTHSGDWELESEVVDGIRLGVSKNRSLEDIQGWIDRCRQRKAGTRDYIFLSLWHARTTCYVTDGYAILLVDEFLDRCEQFLKAYQGAGLRYLIDLSSFVSEGKSRKNQGREAFDWFHRLCFTGGPTIGDVDRIVRKIASRALPRDVRTLECVMRQMGTIDPTSYAYLVGELIAEAESFIWRAMGRRYKNNPNVRAIADKRSSGQARKFLRMAPVEPWKAVERIGDRVSVYKDYLTEPESLRRMFQAIGTCGFIPRRMTPFEKAHIHVGYHTRTQNRIDAMVAAKAAKAAEEAKAVEAAKAAEEAKAAETAKAAEATK